MSTKAVRIALVGLALALAAGGGALVAFLGSDGRLSYTEPRGNPSTTGSDMTGSGAAPSASAGIAAAPPGQRRDAPGFTFADAEGKPLRLADFKGRVVLVNLWATWCPPCIAEMPALDALQGKLGGKRFQVVAVSLDRGGAAQAKRWFERNEIRNLAIYAADPNQFGNAVLPTSLLLDAGGKVAWHGAGIRAWDGAEAAGVIQALMAE
ncbi:MAG: TlpA family protein disulfide reductase [Magnetospirillum sp.]|nr:TlpA family protein disulfide reductase [Magnetospirillum sp.]